MNAFKMLMFIIMIHSADLICRFKEWFRFLRNNNSLITRNKFNGKKTFVINR